MSVVSQTAEYALRAIVCLSQEAKHEEGQILTAPFIAEQTQVPAGYLVKVLQSMSRAGLVRSQRGIGGGFRLACDPKKTTIYDVVRAVDELPRIVVCPLGNPLHIKLCPLHQRLDNALESVEVAFKNTSIAELVETQAPLCLIDGLK
jgi:Rrf2 family protein